MSRARFLPLLLPLAACVPEPVRWDEADARRVAVAADTADRTLARLVASAVGRAVEDEAATRPDSAVLAGLGASCPASLRAARGAEREAALAWWAPTPDGRAQLRARVAGGDGAWQPPLPVDTVVARDTVGCARPAPALVVDAATGWVHVAYALAAPEGPGVFYAHQMDPRAAFEPPKAIVYGGADAAVAVAADDDLVAVAYEDPNARPTVAVALSSTGGHGFEVPVRASPSSVPARRPRVAVAGRRLAVGWVEPADAGRPVTLVVRTGQVRLP